MNHQRGLPIEPGCLALVKAPHPSQGNTVKVTMLAPRKYVTRDGETFRMFDPGRAWVCEGRMPHRTGEGGWVTLSEAVIAEKFLMRIDGPTEEETTLNLSEVNFPLGVIRLDPVNQPQEASMKKMLTTIT